VKAIYQGGLAHLRESMLRFVDGDELPGRVRACYPFVRVHTHTVARHTPPANAGLSYGFVAGPGRYETTLTRPDLYARYYLDQFRLLLENHQVELEVGTSTQPIPIHFSFAENDHIEGTMSHERRALMRDVFDLPDLGAGVGVTGRHPLGQRDLTGGQLQLRDPGGGGRDPVQRAHDRFLAELISDRERLGQLLEENRIETPAPPGSPIGAEACWHCEPSTGVDGT